MTVSWLAVHPHVTMDSMDDILGIIPTFLSSDDPDPAAKQINKNYAHGGGWRPFHKFKLDKAGMVLTYPDDPPMYPLVRAMLRDETIYVYPYAWVLILQADGSYEVSRVD